MGINEYHAAYYASFLFMGAVYALSFRRYSVAGVSGFFMFRNASVVYYSIFSILLGKFVYEGTTLNTAGFNEHLYFLILYYGIVLLGVASLFNVIPMRRQIIERPGLNIIPFIIALGIKCGLLVIDTTPMQELIFHGFAAAHIKQSQWHLPGQGGVVQLFYTLFGPVLCVLFIVYFMRSKSIVFKMVLALLMFETSGFYFSKSGLIVPLVVLLILSRVRLQYIVVLVLAGVITVFYVRSGSTDLVTEKLFVTISDRLVGETGYSNPQLDIYKKEHPPLGYESRYYLGFNALFGITPAVDASREAYRNEMGRYGATSSGHSAVSLYAFWGAASYLILPVLLVFVFQLDRLIVQRISTDYHLAAYLFLTYKSVNFLTVDIQRFVSFQTLIELTFLFSVAIVWVGGVILQARIFRMPIVWRATPDGRALGVR